MALIDPQTRAFFTAGLIRPIDGLFLGGFILGCITVGYWRVFGSPTAGELTVVLLASIVYFQLWLILLSLRIGVLVLMARADINLMPDVAAKLAVRQLSGLASQSAAKSSPTTAR